MGSLYVVSDVHGYREDLLRGLDEVGFGDDDELWILGDLLDRGPDGIGVVDLVRSLQSQAPDRVHVLMGNHEILALGKYRFPGSRFDESWRVNGGRRSDQNGLTDEHAAWLASLPVMAKVGDYLLMHSDTAGYLTWGDSVEAANETVGSALSDAVDVNAHWDVWAKLTSRTEFARSGGADVARDVLSTYGGELIVHGHTIIGTLLREPSSATEKPLLYAEGLALDIDGGRYDGGPLFVLRLD